MQIKEHPHFTKYLFTSPLYIDDNMNVTTNTLEFDKFKMLLHKHDINHYEQTQIVENNHKITVAVTLLNKYITQEYEYDLLTLLMENRKG